MRQCEAIALALGLVPLLDGLVPLLRRPRCLLARGVEARPVPARRLVVCSLHAVPRTVQPWDPRAEAGGGTGFSEIPTSMATTRPDLCGG